MESNMQSQWDKHISEIDKSNGDNCLYDYEDICGKGWNASHEINLMENNGFHEVHAGQTKEIDKED